MWPRLLPAGLIEMSTLSQKTKFVVLLGKKFFTVQLFKCKIDNLVDFLLCCYGTETYRAGPHLFCVVFDH